jgi:ATP-dependent exoDNAse (exonuclease V) alpha subunit
MLFTAHTRAKRLAVWIGTKKAVGIGVRSARDERTTGLADFIRSSQEHVEQQTQGQFF